MNVCNYSDRLKVIGGELVRVVTATPRAKKSAGRKLDVYREFESGRCQCRNLYTSMYGYRVAFPNEVTSLYGNSCCEFIQKLERWAEVNRIDAFYWSSEKLTESDKNLILSLYPDFKYVLNKWHDTLSKTMAALAIWREHREIEFVLAAGWTSIALNRSFWRLSEEKRREVVNFMRNNPRMPTASLADVQTIIKHRIDVSDFNEYKHFCLENKKVAYDVYKYLMKVGMANFLGVSLYRDYRNLLKQTAHDENDIYWKYPKDLQRAHDKLLAEVEEIKAMEKIGQLNKKQERYFKAVKKLLKYNADIDGYSVFIPETVDEIWRQAKALHQCLIANDYVSQVISKRCVLVFIQKGGKPVATAQLLEGNKIGQFYADELDRSNCLPTDEVREVMNKWIEMKRAA